MKNNITTSEINITQLVLYNLQTEALDMSSNTIDTNILKRDYLSFEQIYGSVKKEEKTSLIEEYKDTPGYEGHYQISNLGNIKSLKRNRERVLNPSIDKNSGYYRIVLYINGDRKSHYIHQLVAITFLGHIPSGNKSVIDHINNDKTNNELDNLQVISNRENLSKDKWRSNPSSLYTGVYYHKTKEKWASSISVKGSSFYLGCYSNEVIAAQEYKNALEYYNKHSDLTNYPFKTKRINEVFSTNINQLAIKFTQYC